MPIYEYQCEDCARTEEALQRFSDPPLSVCSECGGRLTKLISHSAFHLKGTGWYVTDYADKKSAGSPAEKTGDAGKDAAGGTDGAQKSPDGASGTVSSGNADT
ncbi:MAG: FmdB family transcriptional regulator [Desulfobacterales bacterium]|nr:MAG: FmdB family transcriptional regulator [Desulfobacterales bacterium]